MIDYKRRIVKYAPGLDLTTPLTISIKELTSRIHPEDRHMNYAWLYNPQPGASLAFRIKYHTTPEQSSYRKVVATFTRVLGFTAWGETVASPPEISVAPHNNSGQAGATETHDYGTIAQIMNKPAPQATRELALFLSTLDFSDPSTEDAQRCKSRMMSSHYAIRVIDANNTLLYINPAAIELLGESTNEDLVGKPAASYAANEQKEDCAQFRRRVLATGSGHMHTRIESRNGDRVVIECLGARFMRQGSPLLVLICRKLDRPPIGLERSSNTRPMAPAQQQYRLSL